MSGDEGALLEPAAARMRAAADLLRDPARVLQREWLLADGLGGWSSQTLCGAHTRREHGLLVVKPESGGPPLLLLARFEEALKLGPRTFELSTNQYPGALHPRGFEYLESFALEPLPTTVFDLAGVRLTRTLARPHRRPGLVVTYLLEGADAAELDLRPLLAYRAVSGLQQEHPALRGTASFAGGDLLYLPPEADHPALALRVPAGEWQPDGLWYRDLEYEREREAGRDFREDLFSPGRFRCRLLAGRPLELLAWAGPIPPATDTRALFEDEKRRLRQARDGEGFLADLRQAADTLCEHAAVGTALGPFPPRATSLSETLRSVPGLLIETERFAQAQSVLDAAFERLRRLELSGDEDAPLWAAIAVARWLQAGGDGEPVRKRWRPALFELLEACLAGRVPGRAVAPPGLLAQVGPDFDLRLRIDTQALWYNALLLGAELAKEAGDSRRSSEWTLLAARVRDAVLRGLWSDERGHLALEAGPDQLDWSLDARQLIALALPHSLLPRDKALRQLERVAHELLTPLGLHASKAERSEVQPAWAGWYFEALIRVNGEDGKRSARAWVREFGRQLEEQGLCAPPQAFAAEAPHAAQGSSWDALAVAELLRLGARMGREPARWRRPS